MQKSVRYIVSVLILGAYLLSACSGAAPQSTGAPLKVQAKEVVFTGVVEATGANQWTVSGQAISVDGTTMIDSNVKVGDIVRVEASVSQDGAVVAVKIESSGPDDTGANANGANSNDNANVNSNDNSNSNANTNSNGNSNDDNGNGTGGAGQEFFGAVQAITTQSITINGVVYSLANFTEFKGAIAVGDQVKIHVIVNADGTLTIREIEKTTGAAIGDDNGNGNSNSNDDNSNGSEGNSNDDDDNDNGGGNGNDDDDDGNSNDND